MNFVANALLAAGASPIISLYDREIEELVKGADAVYLNIGTLDDGSCEAMRLAAAKAHGQGIPWVLDPVAVTASAQRATFSLELVKRYAPSIIRGNASEIRALSWLVRDADSYRNIRCGIDSTLDSNDALQDAIALSSATGSTVAMSGKTDYVVSPEGVESVQGGSPLMARVTAMGCVASALCALFAATESSGREAAIKALGLMKKAGYAAGKVAKGPGSFAVEFLDELANESRIS